MQSTNLTCLGPWTLIQTSFFSLLFLSKSLHLRKRFFHLILLTLWERIWFWSTILGSILIYVINEFRSTHWHMTNENGHMGLELFSFVSCLCGLLSFFYTFYYLIWIFEDLYRKTMSKVFLVQHLWEWKIEYFTCRMKSQVNYDWYSSLW